MNVPFLKRHVFLASFLLSHVSPLFMAASWGMNEDDGKLTVVLPAKKKNPSKISLRDAQDAFETGQDTLASELFTQLRTAGAIVPLKYLEYLKIECSPSFEPVPEVGLKLSQDCFDSSMCRRNYLKSETKAEKGKHILTLANLIRSGSAKQSNAYAVTLFKNLFEKDKDILTYLPKNHWLTKQVKSANEMYKLCVPIHYGPTFFFNCLDPEYLVFLYQNRDVKIIKEVINRTEKRAVIFPDNELKYFYDLYTSGKYSLSRILTQIINSETTPNTKPFWAQLAIENGINDGCVLAASFCYHLRDPLAENPQPEIKDFPSFLYYTSCIKIENTCFIEKQKELLFLTGMFYHTQKNNKEKAFNYWERAADLGNPSAQFNCAIEILQNGGGQNHQKALNYLKLAAEQKNFRAERMYVQMCTEGKAGEVQPSEIHQQLKSNAQSKHPSDQHNYALALYFGDGIPKNLQEARKYFRLAADQGHERAQGNYADMLLKGEGGPIDLKKSRDYFKLAADQETPQIVYSYARMLEEGTFGPGYEKEALKYCQMSADHGFILAQKSYAYWLMKGEIIARNIEEALKYYKMAADQKDAEAESCYANLLVNSKSKDQDFSNQSETLQDSLLVQGDAREQLLAEARKYFKRAADQGRAFSQHCYAVLCMWNGKDKNIAEALQYYKMAADQGYVEAQYSYALELMQKETTEQDAAEARKYFKMAADQGHTKAERFYAQMCVDGKRGPKNFQEARIYFKKAADKGDMKSQYDYANMCYFEKGGDKNFGDAKEYFKKSADQGMLDAQAKYAALCTFDKESVENREEALKYFKIASDRGDVYSQYNYGVFLIQTYKNIEKNPKEFSEALKYLKMAADQGYMEAIILFHALSPLKNIEKYDLVDKGSEKEHTIANQNPENEVEITLSPSDEGSDSSDGEEGCSSITAPQAEEEGESIELIKELQKLSRENEKKNAELRGKKEIKQQNKKEAAALTHHTLTMNKKDFDQTCLNFETKMEMVEQKEKTGIKYDTLELVKSIFGQGQKINTFSNTVAKQAFADLGCTVDDGESENSTLLSFSLGGGRIMKLKYHNPHGHGDHNLYNALKPHLKRFLTFINKTPETLQVK